MAIYPDKTLMAPYEPYLASCSPRGRRAVLRAVGYCRYPFPVAHFLEQLQLPNGGDVRRIPRVGRGIIQELQAAVRPLRLPSCCKTCGGPLYTGKHYCSRKCAVRDRMAIHYPTGLVSIATVAARVGVRHATILRWLHRDPTWAGGMQRTTGGTACLADLPVYPPAPPRRRSIRRPVPQSLRSIGKQIHYSHQGVKYLIQHGRLGYEDGRWVVHPKETT